jgi:hypothetical protein
MYLFFRMNRLFSTLVAVLAISTATFALSVSAGTALDDLKLADPMTDVTALTADFAPKVFIYIQFIEPVMLADGWFLTGSTKAPIVYELSVVDKSTFQVTLMPADADTAFRLYVFSANVLLEKRSSSTMSDDVRFSIKFVGSTNI